MTWATSCFKVTATRYSMGQGVSVLWGWFPWSIHSEHGDGESQSIGVLRDEFGGRLAEFVPGAEVYPQQVWGMVPRPCISARFGEHFGDEFLGV